MAAATITRSVGLPTGYLGLVAGSGYERKTKELDDKVAAAAEALAKVFKRPVEIRFNSDRMSGGAWVRDSKPGFSSSCQVGINYSIQRRHDKHNGKCFDYEYLSGPSTYVKASALKHPEVCPEEETRSLEPTLDLRHDSLDCGVAWLQRNVAPRKLFK